MKFNDFKYERPNYNNVKNILEDLILELEKADTWNDAKNAINKIYDVRSEIESAREIATIRYTINTKDEFYEKENEYWDEYSPLYEEINSKFYEVLVNLKYQDEIEKCYGKQILNIAKYSLKAFSNNIISDMQLENKLASSYQKLIASAKIPFKGEEKTLSELTPFILSKDREIRKEANKAKYEFFTKNEEEIDKIYDKLVKVRDTISKKLGYKNFVELGYVRMNRFDYNEEMVKKFRKQVEEFIVPVNNKLYERQRKRLGLEKLNYYDEKFEFLSGNPTPKGGEKWIINNGKKMYTELSTETKEFFNFMVDNNLMDLVSKKGKASGGYCTYIPKYKAPFIFSNFNGTSGDVDVLTHEAGHAFQVYRSSYINVLECNFPTYESCEIHSMSMEFFAWPWMNLFFKEDTEKYKYLHLGSALKFIPYGITVDEFQHFVYKNPNATPKERKEYWRSLEKKYLPHKNYEECDFLERGGWWFQQAHIFLDPFYYVDYTLAQICALQFWKKDRENHKEAWEDYLRLCSIGGLMPFQELVRYANLKSPFEDGCVSEIIKDINSYLESIDDSIL